MIEITPAAVERLHGLRGADPRRPVLRVYVAGRSCCGYSYGMAFDEASDERDTVVERAGLRLAVDPESLPYLKGATIDYVDALVGGGFMVRQGSVDAGGGCACGAR
ncbi:MAG: HesB/IscA family protein [Candidatus Limnocylindria bacterium]